MMKRSSLDVSGEYVILMGLPVFCPAWLKVIINIVRLIVKSDAYAVSSFAYQPWEANTATPLHMAVVSISALS